jgi:hypothetical protein
VGEDRDALAGGPVQDAVEQVTCALAPVVGDDGLDRVEPFGGLGRVYVRRLWIECCYAAGCYPRRARFVRRRRR